RNVQDAEARVSKAQKDASASKRQTEQAIKEAENARKQAAFAKSAETARTDELNVLQTTYDETVALGKKQRLEDGERLAKMQQDLFYAQDNARKNFDEIQDLKGNLRVMCRIRPQLKAAHTELENFKLDVGPDSGHLQLLSISKRQSSEVDSFQMERIFDKNESNDQIFSEVSQLVRSAINGRNVCIFAYGQTGSGKTHTMTYPWNEDNKIAASGTVDEGIIPRAVRMISSAISETKDSWTFTVKGRFIEIYMDHVYDLLRNEKGPIQDIPVKYATERRNGKDENIYKAESNEVELTTLYGDFHEAKVREMLLQAAKSRHTRATDKNAQSSRSHSILSLKIEGERVDVSSGKITETCGTLNLIDLAGSEKPADNSLDKESQAEGTKINKSLLVLRNVLDAMANPKATQVPFRESTLTKLLQPSLGEGCRTLMFVMVSPLTKDREETRNTLSFAKVAQNAKLRT
ncbi:P-loop containing nucleoside triphosphate hydrolase protein, partial [Bisporella sp. PMI_857]